MDALFSAFSSILFVASSLAVGYGMFSLYCLYNRRKRFEASKEALLTFPRISVIKPVCGLDIELYENLRSFCDQDYQDFEIVFAVASSDDPAIAVIDQLITDFPDHSLCRVVDARSIGCNRKISNVANAYAAASYELIVVADSDMRVRRDYLQCIAASFNDDKVGAATCLYYGSAGSGIASRLGAMFVNDSFLPSVLVALKIQPLNFCFGATMAVRRRVLEEIGGFERLGHVLADDYMLGKLTADHGYKVALASILVENVIHETNLGSLFHHELRWARTVRTVRPFGHFFSILTQPLPLALLFLLFSKFSSIAILLVFVALVLRAIIHIYTHRRLAHLAKSALWLVPTRDLMCFGVWLGSFLSRDVRWRDYDFNVAKNGQLTAK